MRALGTISLVAAVACSSAEDPARESEMVRVPSGSFMRGCSPNDGPCKDDPEKAVALDVPYGEVLLSEFWIDTFETTQAAYAECEAAGECSPIDAPSYNGIVAPPDPKNAASGLDWQQAAAYCAFRGKRLPTEAEWEKAARGPDGAKYPWGNSEPTCDVVHVIPPADSECERMRHVVPVDAFPADKSPYGAIGMGGNVQEWTNDWLQRDYTAAGTIDPLGPDEADPDYPEDRIVRGGFFDSSGPQRASWRYSVPQVARTERIGVRCASSRPPGSSSDG